MIEGELVDLDALTEKPLPHPPAVRPVCLCDKGSPEAHGYVPGKRPVFTCAVALEIAARVADALLPWWRRLVSRWPEGRRDDERLPDPARGARRPHPRAGDRDRRLAVEAPGDARVPRRCAPR
jgi:hypothetical protein